MLSDPYVVGQAVPVVSPRPLSPFFWERFNLGLLAWHALLSLGRSVVAGMFRDLSWQFVALNQVAELIQYGIMIVISAWFVALFWRHFVTSVFPVRPIRFAEAIGLVLVLGTLFPG